MRKVSGRLAPGRSPSFMEAHVLKALELVSEQSIGRATLGGRLGLGEGTVRTMIKRLRQAEVIEITRRGIYLAERGGRLLAQIHSMISAGVEALNGTYTVGTHNYAVLVRGASGHIKMGVEQRDAALMAGARGATTLLYDGVRFHIPGMDGELDPHLTRLLIDRLKPEAGDIVIIGTADDLPAAEMGAKTAALELLREIAGSAA